MAAKQFAAFSWDIPPSVMVGNIREWAHRLLEAALRLARVFAARIEAYAKKNARWTDRSSNARQGLSARAFRTAAGVVILLAHGVDYGVYLELAHAGKFAIIMETLQAHYGPLMQALEELVR